MYAGERFNAWTHLAGAALAVAGTAVLVVMAAGSGDPRRIVGASIFGAALILLYSTSTLYHSLRGRAKRVFRKLDHLSIYLLIAGTYTPFCLVTLRGAWGWTLFGIVWGLALIGMAQEAKPRSETRILSLVIYALMGWVVIVAVRPLLDALSTAGFLWLLAGGLLYTGGIGFYAFDKRIRHGHGIWHLFVIAGSVAHYVAVAGYVVT